MSDITDVAPMDASKRNSPIVSATEAESTVVMEAADRICYWNGAEFPEGSRVRSDDGTYECSFGNWAKV